MTEAIAAARAGVNHFWLHPAYRVPRRLVPALVLLCLAATVPATRGLIVNAVAEAYLQVSTFVALTLALVYAFEQLWHIDLGQEMARRRRLQIPLAAFLGALPGCGGAIVVVTQYVRGQVGFGALIAVLTATMGDAAFLLLASAPDVALLILAAGMVTGSLCGWLCQWIHGADFMRQSAKADRDRLAGSALPNMKNAKRLNALWLALMLPGAVMALPIAAQFDPNQWFSGWAVSEPVTWLGFFGGVLCWFMWMWQSRGASGSMLTTYIVNPGDRSSRQVGLRERVINDTNFVTVWVIAAFVLFELGHHFTGSGLGEMISGFAVWTPLLAVLVGFLPGCGPQIIVATLFLSGAIPFAALLGNAISNDGDALFPAMALAPRAAIVATAYTGVPALVLAYLAYWLM